MIMSLRSYVSLALLSSLFFQGLHGRWLDRKADGWFWYEDREKNKEKELDSPVSQVPSVIPAPSLTATEEMALIRKELEERLNQAILKPSEENVMAYMHIQQMWINQSAKFSQIWLRNLLNHPHLDTRLTAGPVTQYGVQIQKKILRENLEEKIRFLTHSFGLFFFYEGNNKVSQAFSFVVKEFAKKYEWQVMAISSDGVLIPGFKNNQMNQGMIERLSIEQFPSLFLVEPRQQIVLPIAYGLSSIDQIEENIDIQLQDDSRSLQ